MVNTLYDPAQAARIREVLLELKPKLSYLELPTFFVHLPPPCSSRSNVPQLEYKGVKYNMVEANLDGKDKIPVRILWPSGVYGIWPIRLIAFFQLITELALENRTTPPKQNIPIPVSVAFITRLFKTKAGRKEIARVKRLMDILATHPIQIIRPNEATLFLTLLVKTGKGYALNAALFRPPFTGQKHFRFGIFRSTKLRIPLKLLRIQSRNFKCVVLHIAARRLYKDKAVSCNFKQLAQQFIRWKSPKKALSFIKSLVLRLKTLFSIQCYKTYLKVLSVNFST